MATASTVEISTELLLHLLDIPDGVELRFIGLDGSVDGKSLVIVLNFYSPDDQMPAGKLDLHYEQDENGRVLLRGASTLPD